MSAMTFPDSSLPAGEPLRNVHVVVLKGGPPACTERNVSLESAKAVATALRRKGLRVTEMEITEEALPPLPSDVGVVFPVLHGYFGEDGGIQTLLEERGLVYVGCGPEASRRCMDKLETKRLARSRGIPVPPAKVVESADAPCPSASEFPLIVKPNAQGSTVSVTLLKERNEASWHAALREALAVDQRAIAEPFIDGPEITVGMLDGRPLPVVHIVPPGDIYNYDAKYLHADGETYYYCPPDPEVVPDYVQERAQMLAVALWKAIGARDMLRVDFRVDATGTPLLLEANNIPGFTSSSLLPMAARTAGLSFADLCVRLVMMALQRAATPPSA